MTGRPPSYRGGVTLRRGWQVLRAASIVLVLAAIVVALQSTRDAGTFNPTRFFAYFTIQSNLIGVVAFAWLLARGDRTLAAAALRTALDIAARLDAQPLAREITALATRGRLDLSPEAAASEPVATDLAAEFGLTAREREVLGLVALGRTNRQIAEELFITENTAGVHVSNILGKLGVPSRGEAAAVAYRLALVDSGSSDVAG